MVLGGTVAFTAAGTSVNVLEGTRFGIAFKQGPIQILARCLTAMTPTAALLPFINATFTTGTSIVSEMPINGNISGGTGATQNIYGLVGLDPDTDEVVDENIPTGNISLIFTARAACVAIWRAFTPGLT